ncbi:relaxase/mobilization nuclease domain-containing protein [Billgrantia sp. LNSP4103-1]|uniref:relaxase/mobilization nuclease domain-containing protein n=1 Tax=Billgrantia sp. LNSP4103-1 TaxID=3410266 RepID=UPI00403F590E
MKHAARVFARRHFGQKDQYVMTLHVDTDGPHDHQAVKNLGFEGCRLNVNKGDH